MSNPLTARTIVTDTRSAWLEARRQGIGGSDAAAVVGENPWVDPTSLWLEKLGLKPPQPENEAMLWGNRLEPVVGQAHAEVTGRKIKSPAPKGKFVIHQHPVHDFCMATLDFLQLDQERGPGVLEIKTTGSVKADPEEWKVSPPLYYQIQLQQQLMVSGLKWGTISCLIRGNTFVTCDMDRNDEFCQALLEAEEEFWQKVLDRQQPAFDGSPASVGAILHLYPTETRGKIVALPDIASEWDRRLAEIGEQTKALKEEEETLRAKLKAEIGEAEEGILPGKAGVWKFVTTPRKGYTVDPSNPRILRRVKQ